ncbi:MAG: hypothetical protein A2X80_08955 [Geobacteraceae bacterium GWB2_52_12]|nr:MAG: hypothetical protein A2X80_08955 [Geobacteraceae bacterium GWB2_52_12]
MSSILKALKKLEDEKTTRKPESLKINSEIRDSTSFRLTPLNVGIAAVLLFSCGGGATYFYLKSGSGTSPSPSVSETKKQEFPRAATPPPPDIPVVHVVADPIVPAAKHPSSTPSTSTFVSPYRAVASQKTDLQPEKSNSLKARQAANKNLVPTVEETKEIIPAVNVHKPATALRPYLKVDGIAFQEGVDSVAIINGIQATKNSVIEGAKIEAILKDRVLFTFGSDKFEILLGRASH